MSRTRFLTHVGVLVAVAVVVRRVVTPQIPGLNLGGLPIVIAGLLLGPLGGAYVGAISDVVGYCVAPPGPFHPFYTVTAALTGALPPLLLRVAPRRAQADEMSFERLLFAVLITQVLTKCVMIPLFNEWLLGIPTHVTAARNIIVQVVHAPLYAVAAQAVLRALRRVPAARGDTASCA